jgi:hypothetical protein
MDLTTVADDEAVIHDGLEVRTYGGLEPDTLQEIEGFVFRTLRRPPGELLCTFATVNDVHFGETVCGLIDGVDLGPVYSVPEGAEPYPAMMHRHALDERAAADPAEVVTTCPASPTRGRARATRPGGRRTRPRISASGTWANTGVRRRRRPTASTRRW